jgi:hypothetical protein
MGLYRPLRNQVSLTIPERGKHTMKVKIAIQCLDKRIRQTGTFGYREERPLYSVTPIFPSMVELIAYCNKHGIERDYTV